MEDQSVTHERAPSNLKSKRQHSKITAKQLVLIQKEVLDGRRVQQD